MSRYIDADELIFIGLDNPDDDHLFEFVPKEFIDNVPTADVVEVVHGEWQRHYSRPNVYADLFWHCSICGYKNDEQFANKYHNYCPHCGAKMDERREDGEIH